MSPRESSGQPAPVRTAGAKLCSPRKGQRADWNVHSSYMDVAPWDMLAASQRSEFGILGRTYTYIHVESGAWKPLHFLNVQWLPDLFAPHPTQLCTYVSPALHITLSYVHAYANDMLPRHAAGRSESVVRA